MLGKLYKYEIKNLTRYWIFIIPFMFISGIGSTLINKFITDEGFLYNTIRVSSTAIYIISLFACVLSTFVLVVARYYKDLFMSQGYLSFTLPVQNTSHYFCKLFCGYIIVVLSGVLAFLSLQFNLVFYEVNLFKQAYEILKLYFDSFGSEYTSYFVIMGFALVFGLLWNINMFFTAITIGQQFKNRIVAAIVSYAGLYMIVQAVSTVFLFVLMFAGIENMESNTISTLAVPLYSLISVLVFNAIAVVVNCYLLKNKLNLE